MNTRIIKINGLWIGQEQSTSGWWSTVVDGTRAHVVSRMMALGIWQIGPDRLA